MHMNSVKRVFFKNYQSSGRFPDGRSRLDVYFEDSDGGRYIWTPDWAKGTRSLFLEAARVERLNVPEGPEVKRFSEVASKVIKENKGPTPNFKLWALKLADHVRLAASGNQIERVAHAVFDFEASEHPHPGITSGKWQRTYDWILTLFEQPLPEEKKRELLEGFVTNLTQEGTAVQELLQGI
jgi:hypothetical protein